MILYIPSFLPFIGSCGLHSSWLDPCQEHRPSTWVFDWASLTTSGLGRPGMWALLCPPVCWHSSVCSCFSSADYFLVSSQMTNYIWTCLRRRMCPLPSHSFLWTYLSPSSESHIPWDVLTRYFGWDWLHPGEVSRFHVCLSGYLVENSHYVC